MSDDDLVLPVNQPAAAETIAPDVVENVEPKSVRETIEESYKALDKPDDEKPVADKPAVEKAAKPEKTQAERDRDEKGRFAPKEGAPAAEITATGTEKPVATAVAAVDVSETPAAAPAVKPPPGWSIPSKAAWDALPEHIRADIVKRETEISNGFKQYEGLKPFAERAQKAGQTLNQALTAYTGIEELIRQDVGRGLMHIAHNAGMTQFQAGQMFARLAQNLGVAASHPSAPQDGSQGYQNPADPILQLLQPIVAPLQQEVRDLKSTLTQQQQANQERLTASAQAVVDEFKADPKHRYFDDLEETIERLFATGIVPKTGDFRRDLAAAYDMAAYQHPEVREALINERLTKVKDEQSAKTAAAKRAAVSIKGAPQGAAATGLNGSRGSVRADIEAAFATLREGA